MCGEAVFQLLSSITAISSSQKTIQGDVKLFYLNINTCLTEVSQSYWYKIFLSQWKYISILPGVFCACSLSKSMRMILRYLLFWWSYVVCTVTYGHWPCELLLSRSARSISRPITGVGTRPETSDMPTDEYSSWFPQPHMPPVVMDGERALMHACTQIIFIG